MPSNPGQNVHLVSSQIHAVLSSSHLANSSSQLVVLSSYLVESSSHLVASSILLTSPLLVYSSVILQLVVSPFNSSCRTSTRRVALQLVASHFNSPFSISVVWISGLSLQVKPSGPKVAPGMRIRGDLDTKDRTSELRKLTCYPCFERWTK